MDHLRIALKEYGTKEIAGILHNAEVLKYSKELGLKWVKDDETAWCAIFVNWCLMKAGRPFTRQTLARTFLHYGTSTQTPEVGDIAVFWRIAKAGPYGHVGFYISNDATGIYILGGNQSDQVSIIKMPYPQLLDYRKIPLK